MRSNSCIDGDPVPGGNASEIFEIGTFNALMNNMLNGVAYCGMIRQNGRPSDFVYLYTNPAFEQLTGLKHVAGKLASEVMPGIRETTPQLFEIFNRVAMGGEPERFETFVESLAMWFSIAVYSPKPEHFVAIFDVITERKKAEAALRESEIRYGRLFKVNPQPMWFYDPVSLRFLAVNNASITHYGYSEDEFLEMTIADIRPLEDVPQRLDTIKPVKEDELNQSGIWRHRKKDGSLIDVEISSHILEYKGKRAKLVSARDMTECRQCEELLRQGDRRKDEFLAMLAHELRNPLAPIRNAVQWVKMQEAADPRLEWSCNIIDRQVAHMARMLDDLLDVTHIVQGKFRLKAEHCELSEIVNNAVETCRPLIDSRRQALIVNQAAAPQWIEGDRVRLEQMLSNLLNNAAKYTNEGGTITLSVTQADTEALIEVRDSGIGISPDFLPQIFALFTQADHSLSHSKGGLGIGLNLVRKLVEIHGGTITASSEGIGRGSLFSVRLPVLTMPPSVCENETYESPLETPKFRILIVEDYADTAFSMMMLLQMEGHEVETASCGMDAIERAQIFQPQVVLVDIGLPDLDGYEVAKRLRALPETADTVLIALTGYGQTQDRERTQSAGFSHHLLKPMDFKKISALLASL